MLGGQEHGMHRHPLTKFHVAHAVTHHYTFLKVYPREIFLGLQRHTRIRFPVAVIIGHCGAVIGLCYAAAAFRYGHTHIIAYFPKRLHGHNTTAYPTLIRYHYNITEHLAQRLYRVQRPVMKLEFTP